MRARRSVALVGAALLVVVWAVATDVFSECGSDRQEWADRLVRPIAGREACHAARTFATTQLGELK